MKAGHTWYIVALSIVTSALALLLPALVPASAADPTAPSAADAEHVRKGLSLLFILIAVPAVLAVIGIVWFIYKNTVAKRFQTTLQEDFRREAEALEKAGKFSSAADVYLQKLKNREKAALLYEKAGDFKRAAEIHDHLGNTEKAKELYLKTGDAQSAAQVSFMEGEYEEAAKIYDKAGKKIDAALAMERAGRKMAAVRAYREAGEYRHAARLLEQEGMLKEAAEMFSFSLAGKNVDASTVHDFYSCAMKLEQTDAKAKALAMFRMIDAFDPAFRDVRDRIHALSPPEETEAVPEGAVALRSFIKSGRLEPKHSLKLWLQILKRLQDEYRGGRPFGLLSPENILVDSRNSLFFLRRRPSAAYSPPEQQKDLSLDERADVFSLGVILFEMLTGDVEGLGATHVVDIDPDLPEWLDDLVIKCTKKVREDRYQNIDEILAEIKTLSIKKKSGESAPG